MKKNIFASWTVWFGVLQIALAGVGFMSNMMDSAQASTLAITGLGTLGFRFKTTDPII